MKTELLRKLRKEAEANYEVLFRRGLIIANTIIDGYPYKEAIIQRDGVNVDKKKVVRNAILQYVKLKKYGTI